MESGLVANVLLLTTNSVTSHQKLSTSAIHEELMRTATFIAVSVLAVTALTLTHASPNSGGVNETKTLDGLLREFDDAIASADIEKMESLFLPPDGTEDGRNREANLAEARKDWAKTESGPPIKLIPKRAIIQIDMESLDPNGPPAGHTSKIELKTVYTDDGWRVETMRSVPQE